jgi:hypothetical protein
MRVLYPLIIKATGRGVSFIINTRDPIEHEPRMQDEAYQAVSALQELGVTVLYTTSLHRKIAIFDDSILWEGSLNILSQGNSAEVMRRIESNVLAKQMKKHLGLDRFANGKLWGNHD